MSHQINSVVSPYRGTILLMRFDDDILMRGNDEIKN